MKSETVMRLRLPNWPASWMKRTSKVRESMEDWMWDHAEMLGMGVTIAVMIAAVIWAVFGHPVR